jgi:hypothetical protein
MPLRAPGRNFLRDTVRVLPLSDASDAAGGPSWADDPSAGVAVACQYVPGRPTAIADPMGGPPLEATGPGRILTATDPGVHGTSQTLWITHRGGSGTPGTGTALATPIVLAAAGPADPPSGIGAAWITHARRVS